jgi:hypothetical protein
MSFDLTFTADTSAIDQTIANLKNASDLIARYARLIADEAIRLAPYDPTNPHLHLREDIIVHLDGMVAEIVAGENLPDIRAIVMEYGSSRVVAHPYFRVAFMRYEEAFARDIQALLG